MVRKNVTFIFICFAQHSQHSYWPTFEQLREGAVLYKKKQVLTKHTTHRHTQTHSTQTYYTKMLNLTHTQELNYGIFKIKVIVPAFDCAMISVRDHFICFVRLKTLIIDLVL